MYMYSNLVVFIRKGGKGWPKEHRVYIIDEAVTWYSAILEPDCRAITPIKRSNKIISNVAKNIFKYKRFVIMEYIFISYLFEVQYMLMIVHNVSFKTS